MIRTPRRAGSGVEFEGGGYRQSWGDKGWATKLDPPWSIKLPFVLETTPGSIAENKKLLALVEQHQTHTGVAAETVVGDNKYGTIENYLACQEKGITTHLGDVLSKQIRQKRREGIFSEKELKYCEENNTYVGPAGQVMKPRRLHPTRRNWE